ncbi:hypothetical protein KKD49_10310 [Myxococcota bacterium]|nr:hypothetical protein [Myxococcota bacterium]
MDLIFKYMTLVFILAGCSPEKPCSEITNINDCESRTDCTVAVKREVFRGDELTTCGGLEPFCTDYMDIPLGLVSSNHCYVDINGIEWHRYAPFRLEDWGECYDWKYENGMFTGAGHGYDYCAVCGDGFISISETCDWSVPGFDVGDCSDYNLPGQYTCSETCQWQPEECFE